MKIENNQLVVEVNGKPLSSAIESAAFERYIHAWTVPTSYRENGLFTSYSKSKTAQEIPACSHAGAHYLGALTVPALEGLVIMEARKARIAEINLACDQEVKAISASYPEAEVLSWPQQVKEAEALLNSAQANTPLLTALATARGIGVPDLALLVVAKANAFALATGEIIGKRQHLEELLQTADSVADIESIAW